MLDVVIAGGGPVGSRVAYKLAGLGYQVAVIEKRPEIGEKPCCTGIISQECVTTFSIPSEVIFRPVKTAIVFPPSGEPIHLSRPETQACIVDRQAFDRALATQATSKGAEYHLNSKVERLSFKPDRVVIEVAEKGEVKQLEAQTVVLATGFNAPLVKGLGFGQVGYLAAGAQADVRVNGVDQVEVYFDSKLAPGFFAWLVPTSPGRGLVGLMSCQSPGSHLRDWLTKLTAQGKIIPENYPIRYGGIPLKPLARTFGERLLLIGDAAGQVKPTTGGGIYFGLLCADIAADTLHNALQSGDMSVHQMSKYERNWRKKLGHELRIEYFARRLYQRLSDRQVDSLFSYLQSNGIVDSLLKEENISFDWHGGLLLKVLRLGIASQANRLLRLKHR